jgi:hypothetical protein
MHDGCGDGPYGHPQAHVRDRQRPRLDDRRLRHSGHERERRRLAVSGPGEEPWECGGARHRAGEQQPCDDPPGDSTHGSDPRCRQHHSKAVSAGRDEGLNSGEGLWAASKSSLGSISSS